MCSKFQYTWNRHLFYWFERWNGKSYHILINACEKSNECKIGFLVLVAG